VVTPPLDEKKGIAYFSARLSTDHVIASSSIPIFFPPKEGGSGMIGGDFDLRLPD
jgi:predicted acylesterase/phospholipase RssA